MSTATVTATTTVTIAEYLAGELVVLARYGPARFAVYAIRDESCVFYVGRTDDPSRRISQHIGDLFDRAHVSPVGWLVRDNLPGSLSWNIDLYTADDFDAGSPAEAERLAIQALRPCMNITYNSRPSPLPDCYREGERRWRAYISARLTSPAWSAEDDLRYRIMNRPG